jgi:hypothetical protein
VENALVNYGGIHSMKKPKLSTIELAANTYYPIRIIFGNDVRNFGFETTFTLPDGTKGNGAAFYRTSFGVQPN